MWAQYRKTFFFLQPFIIMITLLAFIYQHSVYGAVVQFFIPMQVCAALGAAWAVRFRRKLDGER